MKLSIVLATKNEENNIGPCLESVEKIADEIVIVDEYSTDNTVTVAMKYGAKIFKNKHKRNFHESKQLAITRAKGEWILQLDADERVSNALAKEIILAVNASNKKLKSKVIRDKKKKKLFARHQKVIEKRDGKIGENTGEIVGFFIPRINFFLGSPLIHAGVYPDAVIRLFKKGKAFLPAKSVHEQVVLKGEVSWLENNLEHHDSPTLDRYISRLNRYTKLKAEDFKRKKIPKNKTNLFLYATIKPLSVFLNLFIRHRGYKDGIRGFLWSAFSGSHFSIAYFKYWTLK